MAAAPERSRLMAKLIPCPTCERQVSDEAASCPNCGHPILAGPQTPPPAPTPAPGVWVCQHCRHSGPPAVTKKIAVAGWIVFALLLLTGFGIFVCWLGLLITEKRAICPSCGTEGGRLQGDVLVRALTPAQKQPEGYKRQLGIILAVVASLAFVAIAVANVVGPTSHTGRSTDRTPAAVASSATDGLVSKRAIVNCQSQLMRANMYATPDQLTSWAISAAQHRAEFGGQGGGDSAMSAICRAIETRDPEAQQHFEVFAP